MELCGAAAVNRYAIGMAIYPLLVLAIWGRFGRRVSFYFRTPHELLTQDARKIYDK